MPFSPAPGRGESVEQALLADQREHQQRINAARSRLGLDNVNVVGWKAQASQEWRDIQRTSPRGNNDIRRRQ